MAHFCHPGEALGFLHRDYEPSHFYWEIVEAYRKLFLVSAISIMELWSVQEVKKGSILQMLTALAFCLSFNVIKQVLRKFVKYRYTHMIRHMYISAYIYISAYMYMCMPR